jgi:hypothetical protein
MVAALAALAAGCNEPTASKPSASSAGSSVAAVPAVAPLPPRATATKQVQVAAPSIPRSEPTPVVLGGTPIRAELCKWDTRGSAMADDRFDRALRGLALGPDAALYVADHQAKVRRYVNQAAEGCELQLDEAFGSSGTVDLGVGPNVDFERTSVDHGGNVYVLASKPGETEALTRKIQSGRLTQACGQLVAGRTTDRIVNEWLLPAPRCPTAHTRFSGFDGVYYTLAVHSSGVLLTDKFRIVSYLGWNGERKLTLGGGTPEASISLTKDAAIAGQRVIVADVNAGVLRVWTTDGRFVGVIDIGAAVGIPSLGTRYVEADDGAIYVAGTPQGSDGKYHAVVVRATGLERGSPPR